MRFWPRRSEERTLTVVPSSYLPFDPSTPTPSSAILNADVYSCVRVLADSAASCPLVVYRRTGDGDRRRASGRTADLLQRPAEDTTQNDLVATVMTHLTLWGNAYLAKYRDEDGRVEQLLPVDPAAVQVERRNGRIVFNVTALPTSTPFIGRPRELGLDDLIHVKALSSDGLCGISPIRAMRTALELNVATRAASTALFQNNARPSGILTANSISADQATRIKEQWTTKHSGDRAGGIAVLSGTDLTFTPVAMPADDAQYVEARKLSATEVARAFRVPPWMVGADSEGSMTYSNVESQALSFVVFSLQPWLNSIEQALSNDRDLFGPSSFCEFLIDGLLRADSRTRAEIYEKGLNPVSGWLTRAEVRRLENLPPELEAVQLPDTSMTNGQGVIA